MIILDKHKPSPCKISLVVDKIQEAGVVEGGVGLLVHVRVPVLVVHGLGRHPGQLREEGRVGEVQLGHVNVEMAGHGFFYTVLERKVLIDILLHSKMEIGSGRKSEKTKVFVSK